MRVRQLFEHEVLWRRLPPEERALLRQAALGPPLGLFGPDRADTWAVLGNWRDFGERLGPERATGTR